MVMIAMPKGVTPDVSAQWGLFALINAANNFSESPVTVNSALTAVSITAAQMVGFGLILRTGAPAGAVTDTLDTAVNIIAAMGGPSLVPLDGSYSEPMRVLNSTGQTITITTNTGLTLTGTMTIANGAWRDFKLTPTSATAVTVLNAGGGTV